MELPTAGDGFLTAGYMVERSNAIRALLITGEQAHSRYFSEDIHAQASGPSKLIVVPGARHIDLYDAASATSSGCVPWRRPSVSR
ncbi:hypothetical protein [Arthrobacter sp. M4]|uniref:hypothetical protein n=1 Tax=Arthrobacter sp. M4 TaxID=218160 RepID=UPI001CDC003B|nr:hypothetical protein [Arthrobacter sp. M4]MCA4135411.1 hypothetical protein [Arthrobacter sp. M4]